MLFWEIFLFEDSFVNLRNGPSGAKQDFTKEREYIGTLQPDTGSSLFRST